MNNQVYYKLSAFGLGMTTFSAEMLHATLCQLATAGVANDEVKIEVELFKHGYASLAEAQTNVPCKPNDDAGGDNEVPF